MTAAAPMPLALRFDNANTEQLTSKRSLPPAVLLALFAIGLSSWLLVSGVFAAAVWHIDTAPEGYTLFAHLDAAVQGANVVPALLVLASPPGFVARRSVHLSAALLVLGVLGAVWLTAASDLRTSTASIGLLLGAVAGGIVGSTSMSVFFPLAASTGVTSSVAISRSISAVSAGVGTCGVVAQVLSGAKASGGGYFGVLLALQLLGLVSLVALVVLQRRAKEAEGDDSALAGEPTDGVVLSNAPPSEKSVGSESIVHVESTNKVLDPLATSPADGAASAGSSAGSSIGCRGLRPFLVRWAARHVAGARTAGYGSLASICASCILEFGMPGLLPYLNPRRDAQALFWLTFGWAVTSVFGRALAARRALGRRGLVVANALQLVILVGAVACAATQSPPPLWLSLPLILVFSILHGLVVTSVYVWASANGTTGTTYAGLANQCGALVGSLLILLLVSSGLVPKG